MNHEEARNALLIAEPEELRGIGDSPLAQHVRECNACQRAAGVLLEANALLASSFTSATRTQPARRKSGLSSMPTWLPLPIAAAIAALIIVQPVQERMLPAAEGKLSEVKRPVPTTVVNAERSGDVAVFKATDNITVVWQLKAGRGS